MSRYQFDLVKSFDNYLEVMSPRVPNVLYVYPKQMAKYLKATGLKTYKGIKLEEVEYFK